MVKKWQDAALPTSGGFFNFKQSQLSLKTQCCQQSWEKCGLMCSPFSFTTNACEAANSMLKCCAKYKS